MPAPRKPSLLRAADTRARADAAPFCHPLNPHSEVHMTSLGDPVGLSRIGVHLMRVAPGKESFVYHAHYAEEEVVYILSGRGIAEIGDEEFEVGPGDFMGFPAPSVGHHLRNPFDEDLVYLAAGERRELEIADFPRIGKRLLRNGTEIAVHDITAGEAFPGFPKLGENKSEP